MLAHHPRKSAPISPRTKTLLQLTKGARQEKRKVAPPPPLPPLDRTFDGPLPWPKKKPCVAPARNELNFPGGALRFYEKKGTNRSLKLQRIVARWNDRLSWKVR
jgi:hypothetical protein